MRTGIGIIKPPGNAVLEHIQMLGQHDAGLNHVQIMHLACIDRDQSARQQIRLLLVIAFEADAIAGPQHGLQQRRGIARRDNLALGKHRPRGDAGIARFPRFLPSRHAATPSRSAMLSAVANLIASARR